MGEWRITNRFSILDIFQLLTTERKKLIDIALRIPMRYNTEEKVSVIISKPCWVK